MRRKYWGLTSALFLIPYFFCFGCAWAITSLEEFKIPAQFGSVKEVYNVQQQTPASAYTIIQIQDAHCNYEAQKNMVKILEYLLKEENLKLIMVEGGSGDVGLSFLRNYADQKIRQEVADEYMRMGKISGEEYLDIVSERKFELFGIEDTELYDSNLDSFLEIDNYRQEGLRNLKDLSDAVQILKSHIYSIEANKYEKQKNDYHKDTVSLAQYCGFLKELAQQKGLALKDYAQVVNFAETARLENEIDFKQAEEQRNAFIRELGNLLDDNTLKELLEKSQDFKAGRVQAKEYYSYLKSLAKYRVDLKTSYPQLAAYVDYMIISPDINATDLLKVMHALERKIEESLFVKEEAKQLSKISHSLGLLTKFLNLDLTPEDYAEFQADRDNLAFSKWVDFLSASSQKYNVSLEKFNTSAIKNNFAKFDEFYKLGLEREKSFIKNIENKMNASQNKFAVLITGGFHTPGISRMLKEKGYSYMVVTPVITKQSDPSLYFSVLRGEKSKLEEALNKE